MTATASSTASSTAAERMGPRATRRYQHERAQHYLREAVGLDTLRGGAATTRPGRAQMKRDISRARVRMLITSPLSHAHAHKSTCPVFRFWIQQYRPTYISVARGQRPALLQLENDLVLVDVVPALGDWRILGKRGGEWRIEMGPWSRNLPLIRIDTSALLRAQRCHSARFHGHQCQALARPGPPLRRRAALRIMPLLSLYIFPHVRNPPVSHLQHARGLLQLTRAPYRSSSRTPTSRTTRQRRGRVEACRAQERGRYQRAAACQPTLLSLSPPGFARSGHLFADGLCTTPHPYAGKHIPRFPNSNPAADLRTADDDSAPVLPLLLHVDVLDDWTT
ncbi:hypothetical protein C8R44DRAFT_877063 [Mycena epipterygia]|nr:hypothetical protein C8R44DRAFT_877063 [Mycena epipterygia]